MVCASTTRLPRTVEAGDHGHVVPAAVPAPVVVHEIAAAEVRDRGGPVGAPGVPVPHLLGHIDPAQAVGIVRRGGGAVSVVPPAAAVDAEVDRHAAGARALGGEVGAVGGEAHVCGVVRDGVLVSVRLAGVTVVHEDVGVARRGGRWPARPTTAVVSGRRHAALRRRRVAARTLRAVAPAAAR